MTKGTREDKKRPTTTRQPYTSPKLISHGLVADLTAAGSGILSESGSSDMNKMP
jgi:hypothetical protein